jgi:hypothetical protein
MGWSGWKLHHAPTRILHQSSGEVATKPAFPEISTMGKQCIEELVNVQTELLERLQETNRHWLERVQSEAALASKYATKLTATRSVSEAMTTCQEWTSRQIEMIAEDSKLLVADTQRFMETGARLLWNDWWSNRPDGLPGLRTGT